MCGDETAAFYIFDVRRSIPELRKAMTVMRETVKNRGYVLDKSKAKDLVSVVSFRVPSDRTCSTDRAF